MTCSSSGEGLWVAAQNRTSSNAARSLPVSPLGLLLLNHIVREIAKGRKRQELVSKEVLLHFFVAIWLSTLQNL
jgi:hypothetical protein